MKMKFAIVALFALTLTASHAQAAALPVVDPQRSVAESVAIQALEKQKQDAQQQFTQAAQAEQTIVQQFAASHPGYQLNPGTFAVEKVIPADPKK